MIYLITYELNNKTKDYSGLYEAIKGYKTWWHYIDSTWLIKTTEPASNISNKLQPYIDQSLDNLLVVKIDPSDKQGWLSKEAWEWVEEW